MVFSLKDEQAKISPDALNILMLLCTVEGEIPKSSDLLADEGCF